MADYGHDLVFGTFLTPQNADPHAPVVLAQLSERAGLDLVTFQDHPYQPAFLDTWTLLSYVAASTERIKISGNVINLPLRPPVLLARQAASLDLLSGGRLELGLGAGRAWPQIAGLGGPVRSPAEALGATAEAIDVLRALWRAEHIADLPGRYYPVKAQTGPAPAHRIGIWLGAVGPRMLDLAGRKADGWIAPLATGYETKPAAQARIDAAARAAGRDPAGIRRAIQLVGTVTDVPRTTGRPRSGPGGQPIRTTPDIWAEIITEFAAQGFDTVNLIPEQETPGQLRLFGAEVMPLARAAVAAASPSSR